MNERQLIEYIAGMTGPVGGDLLKGIGDDCAVVRKEGNRAWLLTMDTLIESVHFNSAFHPPEKLGRKVVSVNVSDIAAMGGQPVFVLLSTGMPPGFDETWFKAFAAGLTSACREYGCLLIGGDTVASPTGATFTLTAIGEADADKVVYRSGARAGDTIWVSGKLGFAAAGLELLSLGISSGNGDCDRFREKHLDPRARVELGCGLAKAGLAHAMMDLSDGLTTDLAHLCTQSGVGARLIAADLPGLDALAAAARLTGGDPERWAISGGEDFELLFTADPASSDRILGLGTACGLELAAVGTIIQGSGVTLVRQLPGGLVQERAVAYQGYDHFREGAGE